MSNNFDEIIKREGTNSLKWDGFSNRFPGLATEGALPMWVADADFKAPREVVDVVVKKAQIGIYGYSAPLYKDFAKVLQEWLAKRHGYSIDTKQVLFSHGVVPSINIALQTFSKEGDGVIIQPPVYYPFRRSILNNNRKVISNPLIYKDGSYYMDFDDLAVKAKSAKMLILCSPHNPVGRVWKEEELKKLKEICNQNNVLVFSDEIHSDLIFPGHKHIPLASLGEEYSKNTVTAYSVSKTFNLAGLHASAVVISDNTLRDEFGGWLSRSSMDGANAFGLEAFIAAYRHGEPYLKELLPYLGKNIAYAREFLQKNLPQVQFVETEGTYLVWLDFNKTGLTADEIDVKIVEKAKVLGDLGRWFGEGGDGFTRLNFACPLATVQKAMQQLQKTFS